jgi:hypothetical protein
MTYLERSKLLLLLAAAVFSATLGCDGEPPAECTAAAIPTTGFSIDFGDRLDVGEGPPIIEIELSSECAVESVVESAPAWLTSLACEVEGEAWAVEVQTPMAPAGAPLWLASDAVTLDYLHYRNEVGRDRIRLSLRRADDQALLFVGVSTSGIRAEEVAPIKLTVDEGLCGYDGSAEGEGANLGLTFELGKKSVEIVGGQLGELEIPGESGSYSIHAAEAYGGLCCHGSTWYEVIVQRRA